LDARYEGYYILSSKQMSGGIVFTIYENIINVIGGREEA
jgi:hypothetical protein